MIIAGELVPGSRVPEAELCTRFGISRTPLREALKVLAAEGFVELEPSRGARVVRLKTADIRAMFEVLGALESLAGQLACERMTDQEIAATRKLHDSMVEAFENQAIERYYDLNRRIHEQIISSAANTILDQVYESLSGRLQRARYIPKLTRAQWQESLEQHAAIMNALEQRDAKALAEIMRQHLQTKYEAVAQSEMVDPKD